MSCVSYFPNLNKLLLTLIFLFVSANIMLAQENTKKGTVGLHAGINKSILDAGNGLSFSFHYGFHREKIF